MKKQLLPYLTIPCLALFVTTSDVQAKNEDKDNDKKEKDQIDQKAKDDNPLKGKAKSKDKA